MSNSGATRPTEGTEGMAGREMGTGLVAMASKGNEEEPRCLALAQKGLKNSEQFTDFFAAVISDLAEKRVVPNVANAMCNAGGKVLKMVELEIRYGQSVPGRLRKVLNIGPEERPALPSA